MNHDKKQNLITNLILLISLSAGIPVWAQEPNLDEFTKQSRRVAANFSATIIRKCELEVQSIGLYAATEVCRITAPQIYYEFSVKNNIVLNLVSLNPRNIITGHADAWEQAGLQKMQKMLKNGHQPKEVEIVELVQEPAKTYYRYMSPMIATPFCLKCHGTEKDIAEEAVSSIKSFYPNDKSIGYRLGDLIGAISIKKAYAPSGDK
ncbi:MAG: DUF3365 domain-containing protein [Proteobacteria bacterium]|nr:DUF3365 domain-containing protein [Pseudomonadota bacterium]